MRKDIMMYYSSQSTQKEICLYRSQCPLCNVESALKITKVHKESWFFIIPTWGNEYYITCGNCWQSCKIDNEVGKEIELWSKAVFKEVVCPVCHSITVLKTVKKGKDKGKRYYVCVNFPECKGRIKA